MKNLWNPTQTYNVGDEVYIPTKAKGKSSGQHLLLKATVTAIEETAVTFNCPSAWKNPIIMATAKHSEVDASRVNALVKRLAR